MPCLPIDYANTVIYKIVSNDLNITECYVGHTTDFIRRKEKHKHICNNENAKGYNLKLYSTIREMGGWVNWTMVEVEKYACKDSREAGAKERYWYETLNSKLNTYCPNRSYGMKDKRDGIETEDMRNERLLIQRQYKKKMRQLKAEKKEMRTVESREKREERLLKLKQYRNDPLHREEILLKKKEYHEKNKAEILRKMKQKRDEVHS